MIRPEYLKQGDKIGVVAPARKVKPEEIAYGIEQLRNAGFEVVEGKYLYGDFHQFSGTDNERAADMQHMIDDNSVKAIMCARGGYGCVRIVDDIDWHPLMDNPKWIIGFSDITVFHNHIHQLLGMESIHANMLVNFKKENFIQDAFDSLISAITGQALAYEWQTGEANKPLNRDGEMTAEFVGGNLSMLHTLSGTGSDLETIGKMLFIEDLEEYLYHIDRMMLNMKRSGKLENIAALVVGAMNKMNDNAIPFGKTAEQIIAEHAALAGCPVVFDFPAGHIENNMALILGREATITIGEINTLQFLPSEDDGE